MKNEKLDQEYSFDLRPASMEEAGLFYSNDEQDEALGTVGHLRLDFGHGFLELRSTGYPHNDEQFDTLEFKMLLREFLTAMQENGPLESLSSMEDYCQKHGGAITEDGQTYEGKVLVLSPDILKESYWTPQAQLWYAHDGFGCTPHAIGRSVRCTCLGDGEMTRWNRTDFIGVLKEEFLPDWAEEKLKELRGQEQPAFSTDMTMK